MTRSLFVPLLAASLIAAVPIVRADVKTTQKTTMKIEGFLGGMISKMAGGSEGITSTVAVKGNRMSQMSDTTGQIVDLAEQKVYTIDQKKKEYTVATFAEVREQLEKAKAEMAKSQKEMSEEDKAALKQAADSVEFDVDVKTTGQTKAIAGHNTKETILAITMRGKGKKLEEGGGLVMTTTMWLAPKIAAMDEIVEFNLKYFQAVYGGAFSGIGLQQMSALTATMPGFGTLMEKMAAERKKLQGTSLADTMVIENVKSQEQMADAPKTGGGLGGMLARRIARGQTQQRTTFMTSTSEMLSIASSAAAEDVQIPAGFKEKKK